STNTNRALPAAPRPRIRVRVSYRAAENDTVATALQHMIHVLDTQHLGRSGIIAATLLETNDGPVLFDTGPESTFDTIGGALSKLSFDARDIRHVFLSHILFVHAAAAWRFADLAPPIYVHPRGAPHLIDPAKLV